MSYIGNPIVSTDFPVDYFSGNGSTTAFTLSVAPASVNAIDVQISGVSQSPQTYSVSGTTLAFTAAPPTGSSNIVVRHLGIAGIPNTPSAGSVVPVSIGTGYALWNLSGSDVNYTAGNVGIGTASPSTKFNVVGGRSDFYAANNNFAIGVAYNNSSGNYYIGATTGATPSLVFSDVTATERMRIDSSGNVGIGTAAPGSNLEVSNSGNTRIFATSTGTSNTFPGFIVKAGTQSNFQLVQNSGNGEAYIYNSANAPMTFATNNTERMRIDSDGRLLLNATSGSANALAYYKTTSTAIWGLELATGSYGLLCTSSSSTGLPAYFLTSSGTAGYISTSGTTTSYVTTSDYRLKENVAPMTGALDKIQALKPVTYNWKHDGSAAQGFIAHELQAVVPDCVTGEKDAMRTEQYEISPAIPAEIDADGKVIKEAVEAVMGEREVPAYQGIDTSFLVATLTAAIQEQQSMIEELKTKVAALEAK